MQDLRVRTILTTLGVRVILTAALVTLLGGTGSRWNATEARNWQKTLEAWLTRPDGPTERRSITTWVSRQ